LNYNAYKVFKNGKRAKAPYIEFEYDDPEGVEEYFNAKIKVNFAGKFRRSNFLLVSEQEPQERESDGSEEAEELQKQQRNEVFSKQIKALEGSFECPKGSVGALVYCSESQWKWQWAALEGGTSRYLAALSPVFSKYSDAQNWMNNEISNL
tara:strand:- start:5432 stop:5884 length:453 start_codon:yes stop_codon:yes gene_type:complete